MEVTVFPVPELVTPERLGGCAAVVIDALRMTSVAATALAGGCARLRAVAEVEEAFEVARAHGALLGGERNALPVPGFDLSNSPSAYTAACVSGRALVMTTTNGTKAILRAGAAARVFLGAFVNARAVAEAALAQERLCIVLAGTQGRFALEDALAAGAILARLKALGASLDADDMAVAALALHEGARRDLYGALRETRHFRRLLTLGLERDLRDCLSVDTLRAVPVQGADGWFRAL